MENKVLNTDCKSCEENCMNLADLNKEELNILSGHRRFITYNKGETIFKQSSYISHIVYLQSGLAKIFTEGSNGKNVILKFVPAGEFIGLPFLFNDNYAFFSATAMKKTELCVIEKNLYARLVLANGNLRGKIVNKISTEVGILYKKMTNLGTKQLHGRLASAIIELSDNRLSEEKIYSAITKKELAEFAGMSPESLMRLLNEFKADKIIISEGKRIVINDYEMLVKLSLLG